MWTTSKTARLHHPAALLAVVVTVAASGCITYQTTGASSKQMQRAITETYFFKNTDIFYPGGLPEDPASLPDLGARELAELQRQVRSTSDWLRAEHAKRQEGLGRLFELPLAAELPSAVEVTDTGRPLASIGADGTIELDAKVIQAMFRASLVSTFETEVLLAKLAAEDERGPEAEWTAEDAQRVAVTEGLALKQRVEDFDAKSHLGELFSSDADLRSMHEGGTGWHAMRGLAAVSNKLQSFFSTQQAFLLAHELGHVALGHHDRPLGGLDCEDLNGLETEADLYAAILLPLATPRAAVNDLFGGFMEGFLGQPTLDRGLEALFGYAYEYAGFGSASVAQCAHPERAERLKVIKEAYDAVRSAQKDAMLKHATRE